MRRPVRAEFSAIASSSGREHHCTPAGPNCTSILGPDIAEAMASVNSILAPYADEHERARVVKLPKVARVR